MAIEDVAEAPPYHTLAVTAGREVFCLAPATSCHANEVKTCVVLFQLCLSSLTFPQSLAGVAQTKSYLKN